MDDGPSCFLTTDPANKLHALTLQLHKTVGHLMSRRALISTAPTAHGSFIRVLYGQARAHLTTFKLNAMFLTPRNGHLFVRTIAKRIPVIRKTQPQDCVLEVAKGTTTT